jgi:hypothetical protein
MEYFTVLDTKGFFYQLLIAKEYYNRIVVII